MRSVRTDRPPTAIILYRSAKEAPPAISAWTAEPEAATRGGATWWAQVDPARLLAYNSDRKEWIVDTRGLAIEKLDERELSAGRAGREPSPTIQLTRYFSP